MRRLYIDLDDMYPAISTAEEEVGLPIWTAFLNRNTGKIIFVNEDDAEVEELFGREAAMESAASRAELAASPADWLQIPKYRDDWDKDGFFEKFLTAHGIQGVYGDSDGQFVHDSRGERVYGDWLPSPEKCDTPTIVEA